MKKLIIICFILTPWLLQAQHESTLHFMSSVSQSRYNNPATKPNYKLTIGLPGLSSVFFTYGNSGFAYKDLIEKRQEDDSLSLTLNNFYGSLAEKNYLNFNFNVDLFHLAFKVNPRMHLMMNVTPRSYNRIMFPRDLVGLAIEGNGNMLGQTMTLSPEIESLQYLETAIGGSYTIDRFWTVGARFKYLKGIAHATTETVRLDLTTTQDYHLDVTGELFLRTSGFQQFIDGSFNIQGVADVTNMINNNGYALDLGLTFQPVDKLSLGLSMINLGSINWSQNLQNYIIDGDSATISFEGVDVADVLNGDDALTSSFDSLRNRISLQEEPGTSYRSALPARFYLSGSYEIVKNLTGNLLFMGELYNGRFNTGLSANIHKEFGRRMTMSMSYTAVNRNFNNLGLGVSFNLKPVQLYFISDNLLNAPLALLADGEVNPYLRNMQNMNLRFGLNLVFGWDKEEASISREPEF